MNVDDAFDVRLPASPYPGLRPFRPDEWPIFFGRESMTDDVISQLISQRFVMVHGDSGCGKSSLLKAGVFSRLEQQNARGGLRWRTCSFEPGDDPLGHLAQCLAALDAAPDDRAERTLEIRRLLNLGRDAPDPLARLLLKDEADHLCILADQFEELFDFVRKADGRPGRFEEAGLLVQILLKLLDHPPRGLYAVATMRSEFLGECARFPGFAESVNKSPYLVPRMSHHDLVRAIREPATLYDGRVSLDLAERLILDAGSGQDELPLIQNGLMLLHRNKLPEAASSPWSLDLSDYTATSLTELLSSYADKLCTPASERTIELVFRVLAHINAEGRALRRKQTFGALKAITGANDETLNGILQRFRTEGASLLRPYGDTPLRDADEVSISHEALIRRWHKIADKPAGWLFREFEDRLVWQSLVVQANSYDEEPSNVLSGGTATDRAEWLQGKTEAWVSLGKPDDKDWTRVGRLVRESVVVAAAAEARTRLLRRTIFTVLVTAALAFAGLSWWMWRLNVDRTAALVRANQATAASLWTRLDFNDLEGLSDDELRALWDVVAAEPPVRREFLQQLSRHLEPLSRRPYPVIRAIGLAWAPEDLEAVWRTILAQIPTASGEHLDALLALGAALPGPPNPDQQRAQRDALVQLVAARPAPADLAVGVRRFLVARPPSSLTTPAIDALFKTLASSPDNASELAMLLASVPGVPSDGVAEATLRALGPQYLSEMEKGAYGKIGPSVLQAIAAKIDPAHRREILPIVALIQPRVSAPGLAALADVIEASPAFPTDDPAILAPAIDALVTVRDPDRLVSLAPFIPLSPRGLTDERARIIFGRLAREVSGAASDRLAHAIVAAASRLPRGQMTALRDALLARVVPAAEVSRLNAIAALLREVKGVPTAADGVALDLAVRELQRSTPPLRVAALVDIATAVATPWSADQQAAIVRVTIETLRSATDGLVQGALLRSVAHLGPHISTAQGESVLAALLPLATPSSDNDVLNELTGALRALPADVKMPAAAPALDGLLDDLLAPSQFPGMDRTTRLYVDANVIQAWLPRTTPAETTKALSRLVETLAQSSDADQLEPVLATLTSAMSLLSPAQRNGVEQQTRRILAWSPLVETASTAARSLMTMAPPGDARRTAELALAVLRCPTSAGVPTEEALAALKRAIPDAPSPDAGLAGVLSSISKAFPGMVVAPAPAVVPDYRSMTIGHRLRAAGSRGASF